MSKKACHYLVQGFALEYSEGIPTGRPLSKRMNEKQMVKYAKKVLKSYHDHDEETGTRSSDLTKPVNAWIFLKDMGLGKKTNCKVWK